jgi:hypothetical protein
VGRTIGEGSHYQFRCFLRDSAEFADAINDQSGKKLASLEMTLRRKFGAERTTKTGKNVISAVISALSKVAAFVKPETFVAWDKWAKRGLNAVLGQSVSRDFPTYVKYLGAFETSGMDTPETGFAR